MHGKAVLAARRFEELGPHRSTPFVIRVLIAKCYSDSGQLAAASKVLGEVIRIRPDDLHALIWAATVDVEMGNTEKARIRLDRAQRISPFDPRIWLLWAELWLRAGKYHRGLRYCLRQLDIAPDWLPGLQSAGIFYTLLGKYREAVVPLERFLSLSREKKIQIPSWAAFQVRFKLATCHALLNNHNRAIRILEGLARSNPTNDVFWLLGFCLHNRDGSTDKVKQCYQRALQLNPRSEHVRQALVRVYWAMGERALAVKELRHLSRGAVGDVRALILGGLAVHLLAVQPPRFEEAKQLLSSCLKYRDVRSNDRLCNLYRGLHAYCSGWSGFRRGRYAAASSGFSRAQQAFLKFLAAGVPDGLSEACSMTCSGVSALRLFLGVDWSIRKFSGYRTLVGLARGANAAQRRLGKIAAALLRRRLRNELEEDVLRIKSRFVGAIVRVLANGKEDYEGLVDARKICFRLGLDEQIESLTRAEDFIRECAATIRKHDGNLSKVPKNDQMKLIKLLGSGVETVGGELSSRMVEAVIRRLLREELGRFERKVVLENLLLQQLPGLPTSTFAASNQILSQSTFEDTRTAFVETESRTARVEFMGDGVFLDGKRVDTKDAWRMLEYFLWKNDWVDYVEGYLIFPGWARGKVTDARNLFRQKASKAAKYLWDRYKIKIAFEADQGKGARRWKLAGHNLETNISKAAEQFRLAEGLFQRKDYAGAKTALVKALEVYPKHLSGLLLLARCYEEQRFEDISADEIENTMWALCHSLRERRNIIENLRALVAAGRGSELQEFLNRVENHPLLSQIEVHTSILEKWLREKACSEDELTLAKVRGLLKTIVAADERDVLGNKVREFLELPCVDEVLRCAVPRDENRPKVVGCLLFAAAGEAGCSERLRTMSRTLFKSVGAFKKYLWKTLKGIEKDMPEERLEKLSGAPKGMQKRIAEVNEVENNLRQQLAREPSEDELREELEKRYRWNTERIDDILDYRKMFIERRKEFLAPKEDIQPEEHFFGLEEDESS